MSQLSYKYHFTNSFRLGVDASLIQLNSGPDYNYLYAGSNINLEYRILSHDKFSPYIFGGPGFIVFVDSPIGFLQNGDSFGKFQYGAGFEYQASNKLSFFLQGDFNYMFSDKIDNVVHGRRDDYYYNFNFGVNYKLGL